MLWAYLDESGDLGKKGSRYLVMTMLLTEDIDLLDSLIKSLRKKLAGTARGRAYLELTGGEIKFRNFPDEELLKGALATINNSNSYVFSVFIDKRRVEKNISVDKKGVILKYLILYAASKFLVKNTGNLFGKRPETKAELEGMVDMMPPSAWNKIIDGTIGYIRSKNIAKITADLSYFKKLKEAYFCLEKEVKKEMTNKGLETSFLFNIKMIKKEELGKHDSAECLIMKVSQTNSRSNDKLQALDLLCGAVYRKVDGDGKYFSLIKDKVKLLEDVTKDVMKK